MLQFRRCAGDIANLLQMRFGLQIARIVPPVMRRKLQANGARLVCGFEQCHHCVNPSIMGDAGKPLFVRLLHRFIKIVGFQRITAMACRAGNKVKLCACDASFCGDAVRRSRHFRWVANRAGYGMGFLDQHGMFAFIREKKRGAPRRGYVVPYDTNESQLN